MRKKNQRVRCCRGARRGNQFRKNLRSSYLSESFLACLADGCLLMNVKLNGFFDGEKLFER